MTSSEVVGTSAIAEVTQNANLSIMNNTVDVHSYLFVVAANDRGQIRFQGNRLSPTTPRSIRIDKVSKAPKHDVDDVVYTEVELSLPSGLSTGTEKTNHIGLIQQLAKRQEIDYHLPEDAYIKYKKCTRCGKYENEAAVFGKTGQSAEAIEKFHHCCNCRLVTYCSRECQLAHWADHRFFCSKRKAS